MTSELKRLFRAALDEISAAWIPGLMEHLRAHDPELWERMWEAEEALERVWARTLRGNATIEEFARAVETWRDAHLEAIAEHREAPARTHLGRGAAGCEVPGRAEAIR